MSRGFGTTRGVGASDVINTGASLVYPVQKLAGFAFVSRNGPGGGGYGRIVDFAASDLAFYIDNTSSELVFQHTFSTTGGIWRGPIPANAAWRSVGFTYDQSSVANIPALYVDGAPIAVTTTTAPVGTATGNNGLMRIGNRQVGDRNFDGDIARVAVWRGTLPTATEFAAMTDVGRALRGKHHTTHFGLLAEFDEGGVQRGDGRGVEGVAHFGAMKGDRRDGPFAVDEDRGFAHGLDEAVASSRSM